LNDTDAAEWKFRGLTDHHRRTYYVCCCRMPLVRILLENYRPEREFLICDVMRVCLWTLVVKLIEILFYDFGHEIRIGGHRIASLPLLVFASFDGLLPKLFVKSNSFHQNWHNTN
jgi:hypothetical protein